MGDQAVDRALTAHGIARPIPRPRRPAQLDNPDWLRQNGDRTHRAVARELSCDPATVIAARRRHGLRLRQT